MGDPVTCIYPGNNPSLLPVAIELFGGWRLKEQPLSLCDTAALRILRPAKRMGSLPTVGKYR